ncbi:MAG: WD40 repeat domain-containing protein [Phormidesmis sp.]
MLWFGSPLKGLSRKHRAFGRWVLVLALGAIAATACSADGRAVIENSPTETSANSETFDVSECRFYPIYAEDGTEDTEPEPSILSIIQGENVRLSPVMWEGKPCLQTASALHSPNGSQIATGDVDGIVRLWDTNGSQLDMRSPFDGPSWRTSYMVYSPDSRQLAIAGGRYHQVALWNPIEDTMIGLSDELRGGIEYSPNSQLLTILGVGGAVGLWDREGNSIAALEYPGQPISLDADFNPSSDRIVTDGRDGTVRLWDTSGNQLAVLSGHQGNFEQITYSPDGKQILTLMGDNVARLWDANGNSQGTLSNYSQEIIRLAYSPDSQKIVTGGYRGEALLWNSRGHKLAALEGHSEEVRYVMFSPDGEQIATASPEESTVRLWDSNGNPLAEIEAHPGGVTALQYSPDNQMIVTGGRDDAVRLWDRSGKPLAAIESTPEDGGFLSFTTLSFSPNSDQLLVVGPLSDATYLWDIAFVK